MAAADTLGKTFSCSSCDFVVEYQYQGRKPPFAKNIMLVEDCYIMKDPFSTSGGFVCVGGICSLCGCSVCMSNDCSLFYTQRFCLKCAGKNMKEFPPELQQEISHRLNS
ncbi:unnamed protein product [Candidula unifasciata]|uniref:Cysteine-rich DPF motif domain-containing protein 1 n=1 Tax=Candidula unifasciata TaxID=100452 RepID=A0A8S3Z574_9EUPU|nr:unnamed protein product [Candidula unifasciata]